MCMFKVAVTGGIGSGKSLVSQIFKILNIPVYNADAEAKKQYSKTEVINEISDLFGDNVVINGNVDLKALSDLVFADKSALGKLNKIIHPGVMSDFANWCNVYKEEKYVIMESAIIFEAGLGNLFDYIITVYAPEKLCISNVMLRDNVTEDKVKARINSQLSPDIKVEKADFVVVNDGLQLVIPQILKIDEMLRERSVENI